MKKLKRYYRQIFYEAVINPKIYMKNIEERLNRKIVDKGFKPNHCTAKRMSARLTSFLIFDKIAVSFENMTYKKGDEHLLVGITGAETNIDGKIRVLLNNNVIPYMQTKKGLQFFIDSFIIVLGHELIHRHQNLKVKDYKVKISLINDTEDDIKYLANKQEIMSRAWDTVQLCILRNINLKKLKDLIKSKELLEYGISTYTYYINIFPKDSDVLKRYYKYIFEYIDILEKD